MTWFSQLLFVTNLALAVRLSGWKQNIQKQIWWCPPEGHVCIPSEMSWLMTYWAWSVDNTQRQISSNVFGLGGIQADT